MPPALPEDEIEDIEEEVEEVEEEEEEQIPAKKQKQSKKKSPPVEEAEDDAEEEGDDEYVVEAVVSHKTVKGQTLYRVKWQGYENPSDMTWESADNLEGVEALEEYLKAQGDEGTSGKKRGRKSGANTDTSTPVTAKRMKKEKIWAPPAGSWEDDVDHVDTVEQRLNPKTGQQGKYGYLVWKHRSDEGTQTKTQHPLQLIFKKCPQRMLAYFEEHLVFNNAEETGDVNGNVNMTGVDEEDL